MAFDLDRTLADMLSAISRAAAEDWPEIRLCVKRALIDERYALEAIAAARLNGEIDDLDMHSQLEDEKKVLEALLLVCRIKTKAAAQKAANAAIELLNEAVQAALRIA